MRGRVEPIRAFPDFLRDLAQAALDLGYQMTSYDGRTATFWALVDADLRVTIDSVLVTPSGLAGILVSRRHDDP